MTLKPLDDGGLSWRPTCPIEIIAGTPPGGGQDRPARSLARVLEAVGLIDVPITVINIPGIGGGNAWKLLEQNSSNPHTIAINSPTIITNPLLGVASPLYTELCPLANLYTEYISFVVKSESKINSPDDILDHLRGDVGEFKIALATARGNVNHIALAKLTQHIGGDIDKLDLNVFDSARYAIANVLSGEAQLGAITAVSAVPEIKSGELRVIAVSAPERLEGLFEQVPTWLESGIRCIAGTWRGVIGSAGLTPPQINFWNQALVSASQTSEWKDELAQHYWSNKYLDHLQTVDFLRQESEEMKSDLKLVGLINNS